MRPKRLFLFALLALSLALWSCSRFRAPSDKGSIIFPHKAHVAQGKSCLDCHKGVDASSGATAGKFIPGKKKCAECHEVTSECARCHRGAKEGVRFRRTERKLRFPHAAHPQKCDACHSKNGEMGALMPGHSTCNTSGCHSKTFASLGCKSCHEDLTRYREGVVAELRHGPGFAKNHGTLARQATEACVQCHDQTFCAECHARTAPGRASLLFPEQAERSFIHRGNFLSRHPVEARAEPQACRKCHGQRSCRACHALNGLAPQVHSKLPGGKTRAAYHPAGWMTAGSQSFHGHRARQDIARCASCHDRGGKSNCVSCHRVGGLGGNPHPPGWSWRDKSAQCRTNSMCATCHTAGQGCR